MMDLKPDFDGRFRRVVQHQEADRVPLCEVLIAYPLQSQFLGREVTSDDLEAQVEFWTRAGYDFIPISVSMMTPGGVTTESKITRVLREKVKRERPDETDPKAWNLEFTSFIHEREDFEAFPWDAAAELDFSNLYKAEKLLPEGMKVIAVSGKIFTLTWMLMGFQNFSVKLILDPQLVADVFKRVAEIQFSALESILSKDYVGAVWVVDDLAFGTGPMISPDAFREHVFFWYKKMAQRCHEQDRIFIMHTDGDVTSLMPDIIETGIDVLQPIDPTCMDIVKMKREYGDHITLVGNVANELLQSGSIQEVEEYTRHLLREVAPGGGFCVGSGNSVPDWARFENYMAMRDTTLKHGAYPISI
jgi:uroporphyrinogen decarboxylase